MLGEDDNDVNDGFPAVPHTCARWYSRIIGVLACIFIIWEYIWSEDNNIITCYIRRCDIVHLDTVQVADFLIHWSLGLSIPLIIFIDFLWSRCSLNPSPFFPFRYFFILHMLRRLIYWAVFVSFEESTSHATIITGLYLFFIGNYWLALEQLRHDRIVTANRRRARRLRQEI